MNEILASMVMVNNWIVFYNCWERENKLFLIKGHYISTTQSRPHVQEQVINIKWTLQFLCSIIWLYLVVLLLLLSFSNFCLVHFLLGGILVCFLDFGEFVVVLDFCLFLLFWEKTYSRMNRDGRGSRRCWGWIWS